MNTRRLREIAFQILFQLDAQGEALPWEEDLPITDEEHAAAEGLAREAFAHHDQADAQFDPMAPAWPVHRRPAVDRAILRLMWHTMVIKGVPGPVAINEGVELAKRYSGERSPAFINALLDNIYKDMQRAAAHESHTP